MAQLLPGVRKASRWNQLKANGDARGQLGSETPKCQTSEADQTKWGLAPVKWSASDNWAWWICPSLVGLAVNPIHQQVRSNLWRVDRASTQSRFAGALALTPLITENELDRIFRDKEHGFVSQPERLCSNFRAAAKREWGDGIPQGEENLWWKNLAGDYRGNEHGGDRERFEQGADFEQFNTQPNPIAAEKYRGKQFENQITGRWQTDPDSEFCGTAERKGHTSCKVHAEK